MDDSSMNKIGPLRVPYPASEIPWDYKDCGDIVQIFISHDKHVKSLQFQYVKNGALVTSDRHGPSTGEKFDAVKLNYPKEYITTVSGKFFCSSRSWYMCLLSFDTNVRKYGPFGSSVNDSDREFCYCVGDDGQFGGLYGSSDGSGVCFLGIYLNPINTLRIKLDPNVSLPENQHEEVRSVCSPQPMKSMQSQRVSRKKSRNSNFRMLSISLHIIMLAQIVLLACMMKDIASSTQNPSKNI